MTLSVGMETASNTRSPVTAWPTAKTSQMRNSPTAVSVCVCMCDILEAVMKACHSNGVCLCSANRVCKKGYKRCVNGRCVGHSSWCNGRDDCGDNSDELFCNGKSICSYTLYSECL